MEPGRDPNVKIDQPRFNRFNLSGTFSSYPYFLGRISQYTGYRGIGAYGKDPRPRHDDPAEHALVSGRSNGSGKRVLRICGCLMERYHGCIEDAPADHRKPGGSGSLPRVIEQANIKRLEAPGRLPACQSRKERKEK